MGFTVSLGALLVLGAAVVDAQVTTFQQVCPNSQNIYPSALPHRDFNKPWQKQYPMLIFDAGPLEAQAKAASSAAAAKSAAADAVEAKTESEASPANANLKNAYDKAAAESVRAAQKANDDKTDLATLLAGRAKLSSGRDAYLYWKEAYQDELTALPDRSLVGKVYLTETVLILICDATFGDGLDLNQTSVAAEGPQSDLMAAFLKGNSASPSVTAIDKIYALEQKVGDNSITIVNFTEATSGNGTDPIATAVVERHHRIHFSAGGGLLLTEAAPTTYALITTPTMVTTTTTTNSTVVSGGVTTAVPPSTTIATTAGTAEYVMGTVGQNPGMNAVAGITVYPFGHDTYPVAWKHGVYTYSFKHPEQSFGVFVGTSVDALGNFTVAPSYEIYTGIQLFAGPTWWSKSTLNAGITACSGYGQSPTYTSTPTTTYTTNSYTPGVTPSSTTSVVTVTTTSVSGCSNGDKATLLSGTTVPTQSSFTPASGFGILFNTNIFKSFAGLNK
jgi:hypothetical protein